MKVSAGPPSELVAFAALAARGFVVVVFFATAVLRGARLRAGAASPWAPSGLKFPASGRLVSAKDSDSLIGNRAISIR